MKYFVSFAISVSCLLLMPSGLKGQTLDFDSLVRSDVAFRRTMELSYAKWDIFSTAEVMKISLTSDFNRIVKNKYLAEYQPAIYKYHLNDTVIVTREIKVRPRGNIRRRACFYPPLKLNFPKKEVFLEQLRDYDKLKMVVMCRNSKSAEQYLLSEFYAYKLYNLITDYSFRVKLLEVTYIASSEKNEPDMGYAFFIEEVDQLAKRSEAVTIDVKNIQDKVTDLENLANIYIFQYLIGNTDWSIPAAHNLKFIKTTDILDSKILPVPYDFDFAGIVNANYAYPDERLGLKSVRERVYRGECIDKSYVNRAIARFREVKAEIYSLYENSLLNDATKQKTIQYLDEFYEIVESDYLRKKELLDNCRE